MLANILRNKNYPVLRHTDYMVNIIFVGLYVTKNVFA